MSKRMLSEPMFSTNKNIILSDHATGIANLNWRFMPMMYRSHGATFSQIDEDGLFYLCLEVFLWTKQSCVELRLHCEITEKISLPTIREHIRIQCVNSNYAWDEELTQS